MRDLSGRSLHDREAGFASDTRTLAESEPERRQERAGPYALAVAVLFVVFVVLMIALR